MEKIKQEMKYREEELKRQSEKKIQAVAQEQMEWTQEIKKEFSSMIEENRNRIKMMEEEYQELKQLFDDRPSREEDLRMIQKLQKLVDQR